MFFGYGNDTPGYRVVVPREGRVDYLVDKNVAFRSNLHVARAFIRECRSGGAIALILYRNSAYARTLA